MGFGNGVETDKIPAPGVEVLLPGATTIQLKTLGEK